MHYTAVFYSEDDSKNNNFPDNILLYVYFYMFML